MKGLNTRVPSYIGTHAWVIFQTKTPGCGSCNLTFVMTKHSLHPLFILILYFAPHIFYLFTGKNLYLLTLISLSHLTLSTLTMSTNISITMPLKSHFKLGFYFTYSCPNFSYYLLY